MQNTPRRFCSTSKQTHFSALSLGLALSATLFAHAAHAQTLTGTTADFVGVTPTHVSYDPKAATSNFNAPTPLASNSVAYDLYFRADSTYVYALLQSLPEAGNPNGAGPSFENAYLTTSPGSTNLGFEVTNDDAFTPGGQGGYDLSNTGFKFVSGTAVNGGNIIEWAMPWTFFTNDPLGMGFNKITAGDPLQFRRSQSFGYTYTSGAVTGPNTPNAPLAQVTFAPAPEPSSVIATAVGVLMLGGLALRARRRTA